MAGLTFFRGSRSRGTPVRAKMVGFWDNWDAS